MVDPRIKMSVDQKHIVDSAQLWTCRGAGVLLIFEVTPATHGSRSTSQDSRSLFMGTSR